MIRGPREEGVQIVMFCNMLEPPSPWKLSSPLSKYQGHIYDDNPINEVFGGTLE